MLFTFPSRYLFTIGRQLVFSLTRWSAWIRTKFHLNRATQEFPSCDSIFGYGPFTLYGAIFHSLGLIVSLTCRAPTTPLKNQRFGLFRFRSPLLTESHSLYFPLVTEMFHFTRYRSRRAIYSLGSDGVLPPPGYPIRRSTGQSVFAAHRGFSQLITSFITY